MVIWCSINEYIYIYLCKCLPVFDIAGCSKWTNSASLSELQQTFPIEFIWSSKHCRHPVNLNKVTCSLQQSVILSNLCITLCFCITAANLCDFPLRSLWHHPTILYSSGLTVSSYATSSDSIHIPYTPSLSIPQLNNTNSHFLILTVQVTQAKASGKPGTEEMSSVLWRRWPLKAQNKRGLAQ